MKNRHENIPEIKATWRKGNYLRKENLYIKNMKNLRERYDTITMNQNRIVWKKDPQASSCVRLNKSKKKSKKINGSLEKLKKLLRKQNKNKTWK